MCQTPKLPVKAPGQPSPAAVLCIDVDGTLLKTNLLFESLLSVIRLKPWLLPLIPWWLLRGRAHLKRRLVHNKCRPRAPLPLNKAFLGFLKEQSTSGKRLVLCSGSDHYLVHYVAAQLEFPVEVIASDGVVNLTGARKAQILLERFGLAGFDYAGNARDDLPVWRTALRAIVVNASPAVAAAAQEQGNVAMVFPRQRTLVKTILRTMRIHQWVKNTLLLVPLITSHQFLDRHLLARVATAFLAMGFCASFVYVINDLADLDADRMHPSKRDRPLARGDLSIAAGFLVSPALLAMGLGLSCLLPRMASLMLLSYTMIAIAYTVCLKRKLMADVVTLSLLYTIRIVVGGAAVSVLVSPWLLAFSLFFFLSLAFSKRVTEMLRIAATDTASVAGRGYYVPDMSALTSLGTGSGYLACVILSLYINSASVRTLYRHPGWLWLLLPLLLNWIGRNWIITMRGRMSDDPLIFLCRDFRTHVTVVCAAVLLLLAKNCPVGIPGIEE